MKRFSSSAVHPWSSRKSREPRCRRFERGRLPAGPTTGTTGRASRERSSAGRAFRSGHGRGFSLLEVVLAFGIFFAALAMLSQILHNGSRAALEGRLRTQALLRAESRVAELVAGAIPLESVTAAPFSGDPADEGWSWSCTITENSSVPELLELEVTVMHQSGKSPLGNVAQSLRRWLRNPESLLQAAEAARLQTEETLSSSSGSSGSSSSGGSR